MRNAVSKPALRKYFQKNISNFIVGLLLIISWIFLGITASWGQVNPYTTAGTSTLVVPAGITTVTIECLGAGGGGGGGGGQSGPPNYSAGSGGGGGAYAKQILTVTPGQTLTVTVGSGGATATGGHGSDGGYSKVLMGTSVLCSAQGGFGGQGYPYGISTGGAGGSQGVGVLYVGGKGGNGVIGPTSMDYTTSGGGGGSANNGGNGNNGANGSGTNSSAAGGTCGTAAIWGTFVSGNGGVGCATWTSCTPAAPTGNFGAGGGGGCGYYDSGSSSSFSGTGTAGRVGKVVVTFWNISSQPSTTIQNLCVGGVSTALTFTASTTPGPVTYQWYSNTTASTLGGTLIGGATASSYVPPTGAAGTKYYYCLAMYGGVALVSNVSGAVNVGTSSITASGPLNFCPGGVSSVTLTANGPGATGYSWSTGATTSSITVSPTSTTTYTVNVTGTCNTSNSIQVKVSPAMNFSCTATADNLNGYNTYSGDIINLNAYPVQNTLLLNEFNGSLTGSIGGTWTTSTAGTATNTTCVGFGTGPNVTAMPTVSVVANDPSYLVALLPGALSTQYPYEGSGMIQLNSRYTASGNLGYVTSPTFSTVGLTGVIVDFYLLQFVNSSCGAAENVRIEWSIDGGGTWTTTPTVYTRAGITAQCPSWMNFSDQMPAGFLGQANCKIRIKMTSGANCGCGQDLLIDLIRVTGVTVPGGYGAFYNNYIWSETSTGVEVAIANPYVRATTTMDLNNQSSGGGLATFTVTLTDANGCVYTASDNVNMNPDYNGNTSGTLTANPSTVCSPGSSLLTFNGTGTTGLQWQSSTTSAVSGFGNIPGATSSTYNATGITQTTWYKLTITSNAAISGSCEAALTSPVVQVTVATFNNGIIQNTGETVGCAGDPGQFGFTTLPSSSSGTYSVQWYAYNGSTSAPTGSAVPVGWTAIGGSISPSTSTIWSDNFDGANAWTLAGNFAVGAPGVSNIVTAPYSVANVLGTVLNGNFAASCTEAANYAISPTINLSGMLNPVLTYYCNSRWGSTADQGKTYVSIDNGTTWSTALETVNTNDAGWVQRTVNLPTAANQSQVKIKFTMLSNAMTNATGWNIDNVSITGSNNITYNPPAPVSATTTYAAYVSFTGGTCSNSGWAAQQWVVSASGGGTSTDWTGAIDTDWFKSGNWSCGLPACGIDANIPSAPTNQPVITYTNGTNASCNSIVINTGASLTTTGSNDTLRVCGNWTKNGTYTPNTGAISFVGSSAQTMYTPATTFYNLIIKNTGAGVTINADETVTNVLTLIDGVVTTNANYMIISTNTPANVINGGANPTNYTGSWINGNIRRAFTSNTGIYDFPVGTATFAALARLTNANITGITIFNARFDAPLASVSPLDGAIAIDFGTPYTACFGDGHWDITPTTTLTGGTYNLQLYFNGFASMNASYDNKFGIVKRPSGSSNSMLWSTSIPVEGAGTLSAANGLGRIYANGYAQRTGMSKFSDFAIAFAMAPLPIELISFTGVIKNSYNELDWSTASEINNDFFTLERSVDGSEWRKTSDVNGAGTSSSILNYQYNDYDFTRNMINYYRLSQTDYDGTVKNAGEIVAIDNRINSKVIVRRTNILGQIVSEDQKGIVIYVYEDGTIERVYVN